MVIMNERREILNHGRFDNSLLGVGEFLGDRAGEEGSAVLEATRCWTVMHDWLEGLGCDVTLAPAITRAIP
jgi:hypothetical protein